GPVRTRRRSSGMVARSLYAGITTERVRSSGMRKMPSLRQNGSPKVSMSQVERSASLMKVGMGGIGLGAPSSGVVCDLAEGELRFIVAEVLRGPRIRGPPLVLGPRRG